MSTVCARVSWPVGRPTSGRPQRRGVDPAIECLREMAAQRVDALAADLVPDPIGELGPALAVLEQPAGAIDRDPAHQLAVDVLARRAPHLPRPLVRRLPCVGDLLGEGRERATVLFSEFAAEALVEQGEIESLAIKADLAPAMAVVADPDRPAAGVALEVVEDALARLVPELDPVAALQARQRSGVTARTR